MRLMSFAATTEQMRNRIKTVTRRMGWTHAKAGDRVLAVEKARGVKVADRKELGVIEFTDVRRESIQCVTHPEVGREGFSGRPCREFIEMFCRLNRCRPDATVTRIEFRWVAGDQ